MAADHRPNTESSFGQFEEVRRVGPARFERRPTKLPREWWAGAALVPPYLTAKLLGQFEAGVEAHPLIHLHAVAFGFEQVFALAEVRLLQELLRLLEEGNPNA